MGRLLISFRVSRLEREKLEQNAMCDGTNMSEFFRKYCIDEWEPRQKEIQKEKRRGLSSVSDLLGQK